MEGCFSFTDAFKESARFTRGIGWHICGLALILWLVSLIPFIGYPISILAQVYAYKKLGG